MGLKNIVLIAVVGLAAVGLLSVWNMAMSAGGGGGSTKEGFKATTTDEDIDYYVAVSDAMKNNGNSDPTASEVRRTVAEARKKSVKLKDIETFVRSKGGRIAIKEPLETEAPASDSPVEEAKKPDTKPAPAPPTKSSTRKVTKPQQPTAMSTAVADRLSKELNAIADRIDDLVEEINKYTQQPMDQPVQAAVSTTEAFANFSSW